MATVANGRVSLVYLDHDMPPASRYECVIENNFFNFSTKTYVVGTKNPSHSDGPFELPEHISKLMGKKIITIFHER